MDPITDVEEYDESRPAKRMRLEAPLDVTQDMQQEVIDDEDWDDIYGDSIAHTPDGGGVPVASGAEQPVPVAVQQDLVNGAGDGEPADVIDDGNEELVQETYLKSTDEPPAQILAEKTQVETSKAHVQPVVQSENKNVLGGEVHTNGEDMIVDGQRSDNVMIEFSEVDAIPEETTRDDAAEPIPEPKNDTEFLDAAAAQRGSEEAEWQFDPSDAESSSDSDSDSDDSSDTDSEGGYEMLDPATVAKILMSGEGDDDDGDKGKGKNGDHQPRTANETKEEVVPKPDVTVTADMKITYLGNVERTIEGMALIKAATPGEYQVLESGSVLCNEKREVVGAVADTLGKVQEPMYSVAFTNAQEIEDLGLGQGAKVYYVDAHSTFVFTQPLKNMKGTDASNIHDEEVGEDEQEFSDDEAEAEYKRQRKAAKRGGRGGLSRIAFNEERVGRSSGAPDYDSRPTYNNGNDAPQQQYGGGMSYDDGDVQEEFYSPLRRPENLSELMATGGPPPPSMRAPQGQFDRGRGRGPGNDRGRGKGDRGRGDRGRGRGGHDRRDQRGGRGGAGQDRGGRGGHGQQDNHRGNARSFPDRHNNDRPNGQRQTSNPPKPNTSYSSSPPQQQQQQQQYPTYQQYPPQASPPQQQQGYQFNGYNFQYGNPPPQQPSQPSYYNPQQQQPAQNPNGSMPPPGAFVNPAFFQNQQAQGQWPQAQQQQQPSYAGPPGQYYPQLSQYTQPGAAQSSLADILKQFGGQQQQ